MKIILKFERELTVRPGLYIVGAYGALLLVTSGLCKITVFFLLFYLYLYFGLSKPSVFFWYLYLPVPAARPGSRSSCFGFHAAQAGHRDLQFNEKSQIANPPNSILVQQQPFNHNHNNLQSIANLFIPTALFNHNHSTNCKLPTFSLCSQPTAFLSTRSVWTPNWPPNPVL